MVRLVCFDWGGVLLRVAGSLEEACARAGVAPRGDLSAAPFLGRDELGRRFQLGEIGFDAFCRALAGGAYTPEEIARVHHGWLVAEVEGMAEVVADLEARPGVRTALLSNTNAAHFARMRDFPAAARLDHRLASHILGARKPDPAVYRAFEARTGYRGGEILFFDDARENTDAAARFGWRAEPVDPEEDVAGQVRAALAAAGLSG